MDYSEECVGDGSSVVVRLITLITVLIVFNLYTVEK